MIFGIFLGLAINGLLSIANDLDLLEDKKAEKKETMPEWATIMSTTTSTDQVVWIIIKTPDNMKHRVNPN